MLRFISRTTGLQVAITDEVVTKLEGFKNTRNEQGGMLFSKLETASDLIVYDISTPSEGDKSARFAFNIDLNNANITIKKKHGQGLHYVGDWHSHHESCPTPSQTDIETIKSIFNESKHNLNYLVHIIIGNETINNSCVMLTDGQEIDILKRVN